MTICTLSFPPPLNGGQQRKTITLREEITIAPKGKVVLFVAFLSLSDAILFGYASLVWKNAWDQSSLLRIPQLVVIPPRQVFS